MQVEMVIEPIGIPLGMSPDQQALYDHLEEVSARALESSMDDLRLQGASEEQLSAFLVAARMVCIAELWGVDLEGVVLNLVGTGGRGPNLRETVACTLMPELNEAL
jgi:hypothetical protein